MTLSPLGFPLPVIFFTFSVAFKGVHWSGRVGFVPDPDSTQIFLVGEKQNQNGPVIVVRSFGSSPSGFGFVQVGFGFRQIDQDLADIWPNPSNLD